MIMLIMLTKILERRETQIRNIAISMIVKMKIDN